MGTEIRPLFVTLKTRPLDPPKKEGNLFWLGSPVPTSDLRSGLILRVKTMTYNPNLPVKHNWLVVSTPLKNISQNGNLPQIGVKMKKYLKPPPRQLLIN